MKNRHEIFETRSLVLLFGILVTVAIGGIVEIAPLFWINNTIEPVAGVRPYTPLEQAGRDIYVREGCYTCHSQQIRTLKDEVDRYGPYSLAAESMYDHPFQWGSKRNGPDLARIGGKYSDEWHVQHLKNPRAIVVGSIMPGYPFLESKLDSSLIGLKLKTLSQLGTPYSNAQIENAEKDLRAQASPDSPEAAEFAKRWPAAKIRNFDGNPEEVTELDALVAYLQMLGTLVETHPLKTDLAKP